MSNGTPPWQYTSTGSPQTPSAVHAGLFGNSGSLSSNSSASSASTGNTSAFNMSGFEGSGKANMNMNMHMNANLNGGGGMQGLPPTMLNANMPINVGTGSLMYTLPHESLISKNMSKSFEDDLFFCPRSLLSKEELSQCSQIDLLYCQQQQQQQQIQQIQQNHVVSQQPVQQQRPRFNPYVSQSFNPGAA